jgi:hypothetical protein
MTFIERHSIIHFTPAGDLRYTVSTVKQEDLEIVRVHGSPIAQVGQVEVILGSTADGNRPEHRFMDRADYLALAEREGWSVRPGPDGEPYPREPGRGFWGGDGIWRRGWAETDDGSVDERYELRMSIHWSTGEEMEMWQLKPEFAPPELVEDPADVLPPHAD